MNIFSRPRLLVLMFCNILDINTHSPLKCVKGQKPLYFQKYFRK
nr:MAG TPA: hypothetical protein [Caudoviricetes sp.]DAY52335.1 MAG TPA: hypothetical protein [Caudoviricetes sp.]